MEGNCEVCGAKLHRGYGGPKAGDFTFCVTCDTNARRKEFLGRQKMKREKLERDIKYVRHFSSKEVNAEVDKLVESTKAEQQIELLDFQLNALKKRQSSDTLALITQSLRDGSLD